MPDLYVCPSCSGDVTAHMARCPSCGQNLPPTGHLQPKGNGLPSAQVPSPVPEASFAVPQSAGLTAPMYQYSMVQVPRNFAVSERGYTGQEAATYLQQLVDKYAVAGWEFYRVESMGVTIQPSCGCLGGGQPQQVEYQVVCFRRLLN